MSRRGRWTRRPRRSPRRPVRRAPRAARHSGLPVSWCREPPFRSYAAQLPGRSRFEPQFLQIRAQRVEAVSPHKRGSPRAALARKAEADPQLELVRVFTDPAAEVAPRRGERPRSEDTRLNSSHVAISYAVFCLKKKKKKKPVTNLEKKHRAKELTDNNYTKE